jgi:hypothetical protein
MSYTPARCSDCTTGLLLKNIRALQVNLEPMCEEPYGSVL